MLIEYLQTSIELDAIDGLLPNIGIAKHVEIGLCTSRGTRLNLILLGIENESE